MLCPFRFYCGHFEYYIVRHWVLLKPPGLFLSRQSTTSRFRQQVLSHILWVAVPTSVYCSGPLMCCLGQFSKYATRFSLDQLMVYMVIQFSNPFPLFLVSVPHKLSLGMNPNIFDSLQIVFQPLLSLAYLLYSPVPKGPLPPSSVPKDWALPVISPVTLSCRTAGGYSKIKEARKLRQKKEEGTLFTLFRQLVPFGLEPQILICG